MQKQYTNNSSYFEEVKAMVTLAKEFPRDIQTIKNEIKQACSNYEFAKQCVWQNQEQDKIEYYASNTLVKFIANAYGNFEFGVKQLSHNGNEGTFTMFCWDMEKNIKKTDTHTISAKKIERNKETNEVEEFTKYEYDNLTIFSKLNSCIKSIIPAEIFDEAFNQCLNVLGIESKNEKPAQSQSKTVTSQTFEIDAMPASIDEDELKQDALFDELEIPETQEETTFTF
jgi:hypothetical protein